MEQTISKQKLPSFIALAAESIETYKIKWFVLLTLTLASYLIGGLADYVRLIIIKGGYLSADSSGVVSGYVISFAVYAIALIASCWLTAAMIIALENKNEPLKLRDLLRKGKFFVFPLVWTSLLLVPIYFLGWLFFIIPGIIFSVWFLFTNYIVITDNERGVAAIVKSREYARGYFWNIVFLTLPIIFLWFFTIPLLELSVSFNVVFLFIAAMILAAPFLLIYFYLIFDYLRKIKGEVKISQDNGAKKFFTIFAYLGVAFIAGITALMIYFAPEIKEIYEAELEKAKATETPTFNGERPPSMPFANPM